MNVLKMMEESCKVVIMADGQLYFEEVFVNNIVASKFITDWLSDEQFRMSIEPFSPELKIPDHFSEELPQKDELLNKIIESSPSYEVSADVRFEILKKNSYIVVGYEDSKHEMVFG